MPARIEFQCDPSHAELFRSAAKSKGLTLSAWARMVMLEASAEQRIPTGKPVPIDSPSLYSGLEIAEPFGNIETVKTRPTGSLWNVPNQDWEWEERFSQSEGRHSSGAGELGLFIAKHREES